MPTKTPYAVWAVTRNGEVLGHRIRQQLADTDLFLSTSLAASAGSPSRSGQERVEVFDKLTEALAAAFDRYRGHIFIMSAGIVVRALAPLIRHKAVDPAVVVIDVPDEEVIKRILKRGLESGRADDADEDIIRNRLEKYKSESEPCIDYYASSSVTVHRIDGVGGIDEITQRILKALE